MSGGRWITLVSGCCTAEDAQRVERLVEQMLDRRDEYGDIDDDERSEVFAHWRKSLGPRPSWLRVHQQDALVNIRYRDPTPRLILHTAAGVALAVAAFWMLFHWSLSGFDAALCVIVAAVGVVGVIMAFTRRRVIIVNATHIARSATWPLSKLRQVAIERRLVQSLDCRSRTVTKRLWKRHVWSWDRRYNSIRYRRYWVVGYNAELGHFRITDDLRSRREALHLMNEIGSALKVVAATMPWSDDGDDEACRFGHGQ